MCKNVTHAIQTKMHERMIKWWFELSVTSYLRNKNIDKEINWNQGKAINDSAHISLLQLSMNIAVRLQELQGNRLACRLIQIEV